MPISPRTRHDGWTDERQAIFVAALRISRSVTRAAQAAGMSRKSAYALRRRPAGARFAACWEHALRPGVEGNTALAVALVAGRAKVTAAGLAMVTNLPPHPQTAPTVNLSQLRSRRLAGRALRP